MQAIIIEYETPINTSIQEGDLAFFVPTNLVGTTLSTYSTGDVGSTRLLGVISNVETPAGEAYPRIITIIYDDNIITEPPIVGDFLMFAKDRRANTSSLKGYYAEIDMTNDSHGKIELFSIGLGTTASSN
tara:strand:- start:2563 stop:2952 length:390 start_codon:yes stop_codon:yes gene_type:complete